MSDPIEEERPVPLNIQMPADIDSDCDIEKQMRNIDIDRKNSLDHDGKGIGKGYQRKFKSPTKAVLGSVQRSATFAKVEKGVTQVSGKLNKVPGVSKGASLFADYRKFLDRGNVVDLAVAVVIGAAFTGIVNSLVTDIISPILAVASGKTLEENFVVLRRSENATGIEFSTRSEAKETGSVTWNYGNFLQTVINFFIISACVFVIVKVYEMGRTTKTASSEKSCPYCDKAISLAAKRCPMCTTWLHMESFQEVDTQVREAKRSRRPIQVVDVDHSESD
ncbi:hypothetical protein BGW42_003954 [Actinomortierella wolfii]|nr:hypothetical protein BGW42_003954 [Actinomortierella wolfii]